MPILYKKNKKIYKTLNGLCLGNGPNVNLKLYAYAEERLEYCADSRKTAEDDDVSVLRVDRCDVTDVGEYVCEAENYLGRSADRVVVTGLKTSSCHNSNNNSNNKKVILYDTNDKRTCLHAINKLPRRTAQQVPARRPACIRTGFSKARSCHTTSLSGCNQPHEAYNPVGIYQMAPPSTRPVNKPNTYLSTQEG